MRGRPLVRLVPHGRIALIMCASVGRARTRSYESCKVGSTLGSTWDRSLWCCVWLSPFTLSLSRQDREQYVKGIQLHTPPGLLAMLSSVPLCGDAEANAGTCSEASKIGTTRAATGAGSHPFEIGGDVYLTGPYDGAPFGLSVVTHVVAGPFNLG